MASIIDVTSLGKRYRLGTISTGTLCRDLYECLDRWRRHWIHNVEDMADVAGERKYIWALSDVNFSIAQGEKVGVVGSNGAGKSTLLKILSRITLPTFGSAVMRGRVASLLEVGTGFHPELTGRENIFMNGAIMGMSIQEIRKKLDEIVDFSGCEEFIDTPVKRYSSGMVVRLGFSVASHLEPEILVVDEVLAVGDAKFRNKAIGKMKSVSEKEGRTILFVSHSMGAVKSLCNRALWLRDGRIVRDGTASDVVDDYIRGGCLSTACKNFGEECCVGGFSLSEVCVCDASNKTMESFDACKEIVVRITYTLLRLFECFHLTLHIKNSSGNVVFSCTGAGTYICRRHTMGKYVQYCRIPAGFLNSGCYYIDIFAVDESSTAFCIKRDVVSFSVSFEKKCVNEWLLREPGDVCPNLYFEEHRL